MSVSQETIENLERVLKQADLVKFAKSKPLDFEITEDRNKIQKAILTLDMLFLLRYLRKRRYYWMKHKATKQVQIQLKKNETNALLSIAAVLFY
jgi:hypothetical protein